MPFLLPARFGRARRRLALYGLLCASALGLTACGSLPPMPPRTASTALAAPQATPLGQMVQTQRQTAGTRYTSGFTLLGGAQAAFTSRLALVQAAGMSDPSAAAQRQRMSPSFSRVTAKSLSTSLPSSWAAF